MALLAENGKRVVAAQLNGTSIRALHGSMISYVGNVEFKSAGFGGGDGIAAGLKRRATGESLRLMECSGHGIVYLADNAQYVTVVNLNNEQLRVESQQLLAIAGNLQLNVMFAGVAGLSSGQGLATTTVQGNGQIALISRGGPLIHLEVSPQYPLVVDPDSFVAARGNVQSSFKTDVTWRSAIGQGSGEAFSLVWTGSGVVSIQPAER